MAIIEFLDVLFTIIGLIQPIAIFGVIIFVVIKITKSSGNTKYGNGQNYNQTYNQNGYNMNQNGYNMNQNGYNANQNNQYYNQNQYVSPYDTINNQNNQNNQTYYNQTQSAVGYYAAQQTTANMNNDHNHAYEHKVAPIEEVSVLDKFEDRKEAYLERKEQMRADLPKTSYSKMEEAGMANYKPSFEADRNVQVAKSSNSVLQMNDQQEKLICKNCGAENIVPTSRATAYNCYFCKETL